MCNNVQQTKTDVPLNSPTTKLLPENAKTGVYPPFLHAPATLSSLKKNYPLKHWPFFRFVWNRVLQGRLIKLWISFGAFHKPAAAYICII